MASSKKSASPSIGSVIFKKTMGFLGQIGEDSFNSANNVVKNNQQQVKADIDAKTWDNDSKVIAKIGVNTLGFLGKVVTRGGAIISKAAKDKLGA